MKKINIIKKNIEFNRIIKNTKVYKTKSYIIYIERKEQESFKFGISVSKKIGNAVIRNKIKRQIKSIIDKKDYKNDFNCIIIVRKNFLNNSFSLNAVELYEVFENFYLFKNNVR